ncbi:hypothetical protein ACH419_35875 [Streptomyces bobili]|uniref:hypothetical protein n=1 Tax=Streptomyces bobili TaxID=67280 RepID=UPI0037874C70
MEGQQDGRFVHTLVPSTGHEEEQTGAGSSVPLSPHTEDASPWLVLGGSAGGVA